MAIVGYCFSTSWSHQNSNSLHQDLQIKTFISLIVYNENVRCIKDKQSSPNMMIKYDYLKF